MEQTNVVFVWAKMKKYSAWPAKICEDVPENIPKPKQTEGRVCVYFYGTHNYAWLRKENIQNYSEYRDQLVQKNKTASFRKAVDEIEEEIRIQVPRNAVNGTSSIEMPHKITLKDMPINAILATFDEGIALLQSLYTAHANKTMDHLIHRGNGLDYLTILYRTVTQQQQQQMYLRILTEFANNQKKYFENPKHENLFWTIILPEWVVFICMKKFTISKDEVLKRIEDDDARSFNASNLDLSI